ncbi:MAG TPA: MlaD family protein [Thermoanaerobaculia bacterium]|nr:MlaD family protein [Thermoanaerobaculia bacterium]
MVGEYAVGRRFRVGIVVLIALVAVMVSIFTIGRRANLFRKKFPYETRFDSASGLVTGNPVRLNGVNVGTVLEVVLSGDPADRTVRVVYDVDRRAAPRLRKGTHASIKTIGLLGDKYIELEGGTAEEPVVEIGGEIPPAPGAGIEKLLEGGGDLVPDLAAIARSLKNILVRTEQGKGFLGALTSEGEESARLGNSLHATLVSLNTILKKVETGHGLAGKLLADDRYGRETGESLQAAIHSIQSVFRKIDESLRTNTGAIPALLSEPEGKKKVYALVDNLSAAALSLARVTESLEKGDGTIPLLLRDEKLGKEFTNNLRNFSRSLDSIGRKLDEGKGTAGRLINDPSLFDAANHLVVGVNQSSLLRALIRNRQKAGIKKDYDETVRKQTERVSNEPEETAQPTPTRTPSPR